MRRSESESLNVDGLAAAGTELSGEWQTAAFPRLLDRLASREGGARAVLQFRRLGQRAVAEGRLTADLRLRCQRCLEPLAWHLEVPLKLAFVADDASARDLPDEYDPSLAPNGDVSLVSLIEDELLLALPLVALHPAGARCAAPQSPPGAGAGEETSATTAQRPFAQLRDWLKQ